MKYHAEIDGLRAFSVLSVVAFHVFPESLKGGFVGVDVFFVISGFLITTIIYGNLERSSFSILEFYARRIKRIFPSLLLVLASVLVFGWYALLADEYEQLGKHIAGGGSFVANLVLWDESRYYFGNSASAKPLLHLWSLGIEEQFYILWPLLLWLAWRSKIGPLIVTLGVFIGSFYFNLYEVGSDPIGAFYSPLTRFWELAVGGLLAYLAHHKYIDVEKLSSATANTLSVIGLSFLVLSVTLIHENHLFPGWLALPPVSGAALIIISGNKSSINRRLLSNKIAVWFGLISYPLYLWHWPLLSFGTIFEGGLPDQGYRNSAVIFSILLAWMTYRFVERPIRSGTGYRYVSGLLLFNILLVLGGVYVYANHGIPERDEVRNSEFNEEVSRQFMGPLWPYTENDLCLEEYSYEYEDLLWWFCMKSDDREPTLILLGSSYANQLYPGFVNNSLLEHHTTLSLGNCAVGSSGGKNPKFPCYGDRIVKQEEFVNNVISKSGSIKFAILNGMHGKPTVDYIERVRERVEFLESEGIRVIIFTPHLKPDFHPKACFERPLENKPAKDCSFPADQRIALYESFRPLIESISKTNPNVVFFEQNEIFCRGNKCSYMKNGMPLHRDPRHISEFASIELQKYFTQWANENIPEIFDSKYIGR